VADDPVYGETCVDEHGQAPGAPTMPCGDTRDCPTSGPCIAGAAGFASGGAIISGVFGIAPGRGAVTPDAPGSGPMAPDVPCAIEEVLMPTAMANKTDLTSIWLFIKIPFCHAQKRVIP
jgi:hypothetical protein